MVEITTDDIRVLAQASSTDAALVLLDGRAVVLPGSDVDRGRVVYTRAALTAEYGEEITDIEAELLAAGLTARLSSSGP
jgi:hypothetical protein